MHVQYEIYILYIRRYKYTHTHTPTYLSAYRRLCACMCLDWAHLQNSQHILRVETPASLGVGCGVVAALAVLTADIGMKCLANSFLYTNTYINSLK